jgi:hypothetical protein
MRPPAARLRCAARGAPRSQAAYYRKKLQAFSDGSAGSISINNDFGGTQLEIEPNTVSAGAVLPHRQLTLVRPVSRRR